MEYKGFTYTPTPKTAWDNLSMLEKSEMMRVAVRNGITDLKTIREKYNEFAEGGDTKWTMEDEARYMEWRQSLPDNLRLTNDNDYDMRAAFKAGMQPVLESDGLYHLGSRDPETGRILKAPHHPTYLRAINTDARMGYYPVVDDKGQTYTQTWEGNKFAEGGIHIKPENRGKFTALKERTGHSATWFKEHGTPAQKKMAIFALNSRHWKHGLGGNLFYPGGYVRSKNEHPVAFDEKGNLVDQVTGETGTMKIPEIVVTGRDLTKPYISSYDGEAILPFIQLFDPTGLSNLPTLFKDLSKDDINWGRTALDAVSVLPYFKYGKAARTILRQKGKIGQALSLIPTVLSNGEKRGLELLNKGYNKITGKNINFAGNARSYLDYIKAAARLSPAENTTRWGMEIPMHYSGGQPQGVHQGPVHTLLGDNTYYTGFFKANPETDIAGDYSVKEKDALNQYFYGDGNLTPYTGKHIQLNGETWNLPHFKENLLPIERGDTLELSLELYPFIEQKIKNNGFIGLNTNSLRRISPDREGTVILNGRSLNVKPFEDSNRQMYLKAFDKFDFAGTVLLGLIPDSYTEATKSLYPNSGPFAVVQDSIPISFKEKGKDTNMFMDMMKDYNNVYLQGQKRK